MTQSGGTARRFRAALRIRARPPSSFPLPLGDGEGTTDHPLSRCHPEAPPWRGRRIPSYLERFDLNPSIWTKGTFGSPHAVPCRHPASRSGRPPSGPAPRYPGASPLPSRPPRSPAIVPPPQTRKRARSPSLPRTQPVTPAHAVVIPARSRHPRESGDPAAPFLCCLPIIPALWIPAGACPGL